MSSHLKHKMRSGTHYGLRNTVESTNQYQTTSVPIWESAFVDHGSFEQLFLVTNLSFVADLRYERFNKWLINRLCGPVLVQMFTYEGCDSSLKA